MAYGGVGLHRPNRDTPGNASDPISTAVIRLAQGANDRIKGLGIQESCDIAVQSYSGQSTNLYDCSDATTRATYRRPGALPPRSAFACQDMTKPLHRTDARLVHGLRRGPKEEEVDMPKFMDVHHGMHGITPEALQAAHQADVDIQGEEGVEFQRAWGDPDSGMVWCVSEAPDADAVRRIHERTGHPATEVYPVPVEV